MPLRGAALRRRRDVLRASFAQLGLMAAGSLLTRCGGSETNDDSVADGGASGVGGAGVGGAGGGGAGGQDGFGKDYDPPAIDPPTTSNIANLGPLEEPDALGLRLPVGFTARIVARSSEVVEGTSHTWHAAPDGGATFLANDGGYVYVSNSETLFDGGAGALSFSEDGTLLDAYRILSDTRINCAGGPTPWGSWLSCEEVGTGQVFECDPFGVLPAVARPALGVFKHEAVAVDPVANRLYLTEDVGDGRLYRYTPSQLIDGRADLSQGTVDVLRVVSGIEGAVEWLPLPDPSGQTGATRLQVPDSTPFEGGEGIWFHEGIVYFTTKGDNRVWALDTVTDELLVLYDDDLSSNPILSGVDNVVVSAAGDVLVAEDGGDLQIVAIVDGGATLVPLVQVVGQDASEITGPAFDPYRQRLYFSSQRGESGGLLGEQGITYEVTGPFFT